MHVAGMTLTSLILWPFASTVMVSLESSALQTEQYTTLSYEPAVVQVGSTLFSTTTSPAVWPGATLTFVSLESSNLQTEQYTTSSYEPLTVHVAGTLFSTTMLPALCSSQSDSSHLSQTLLLSSSL